MPRFSVWSQQQLTKVTSLNADDAFVLATDTPEAKAIEVEDLASELAGDAAFTGAYAPLDLLTGGHKGLGTTTTANYPLTTSKASIEITGDIDIRCRCSIGSLTEFHNFVTKDANDPNRSWSFWNFSTNRPRFRWTPTGLFADFITVTGNTAFSVAAGQTAWFRVTLDVDNGAGGYEVKFWEAPDQIDDPTTWTQVGSTVVGGSTTSISAGTNAINIASFGGNVWSTGVQRRMRLRDGINGTVVADWRADIPTLRYDDGLGNIWVITGTGYAWTK